MYTDTDERMVPERLLADEELSLVSAIRDTFLPRYGERDRSLFTSIIVDLWPNVEVPLDFAGGLKDMNKEDPPTTAVSKTTSRPYSQTTNTTNAKPKREKKMVIPGIQGKLHIKPPRKPSIVCKSARYQCLYCCSGKESYKLK